MTTTFLDRINRLGSIKAQSLAESAHSADFDIFLKLKALYLENGKSDHSKGHIFVAQFFDANNGEIVFHFTGGAWHPKFAHI